MIGILVTLLVVIAAYGTEYIIKYRGLDTATIIKIQNNRQTAAMFGVDVFRQLNSAGPSLSAVLTAAGIERFGKVEVKGLTSKTPYQISKNDLNDDLKFNFTDHGRVDLCNRKDVKHILVQDVSEIDAFN